MEARTCMNAREVMAPAKTVKRGFFMAMMAAMMNDKAAKKPWMKSSSETEDPVFASCSAADSELSSLLCLTFSPDSSSGSGSHLTRLVNRYMENKNTNAKLFLSIFTSNGYVSM